MVRLEWQHQTHRRAAMVHGQMQAAKALMQRTGQLTPDQVENELFAMYWSMLDKLYTEDFPMARLLDDADLILHAEGPAAEQAQPKADVVSWLCDSVAKQTRALLHATQALARLPMESLRRGYDLRLAGLAPGSLYLGFNLTCDLQGHPMDDAGDQLLAAARAALRALPTVPQFVQEDAVSPALAEQLPEAGFRDASLMAAYQMAPTGKRGIDTVEFTSREDGKDTARGTLSANSRAVLRRTVRHRPMLSRPRQGHFEGEVREVDLDTQRFKLRTRDGVFRCALGFEVSQAKQILGAAVKVTGSFETGTDGKPALIRADAVKVLQHEIKLED